MTCPLPTGGTPTQNPVTTAPAAAAVALPFDAKQENELASAPKGLILIVKEPGESNLIAGEQVDGNLNPIGLKLNGTTSLNATSNISATTSITPKIGVMSNKMGNMKSITTTNTTSAAKVMSFCKRGGCNDLK